MVALQVLWQITSNRACRSLQALFQTSIAGHAFQLIHCSLKARTKHAWIALSKACLESFYHMMIKMMFWMPCCSSQMLISSLYTGRTLQYL